MKPKTRLARKTILGGIVASAALGAMASTVARGDARLYDNGSDGFPGSKYVSFNHSPTGVNAATDDFTLSSAATLDKVVFAERTLNFSGIEPIPATVDWCIGTSFFAGDVGCGTAILASTLEGTSGPFWDYSAWFSLPDLALGAGKYYLTLGNATDLPPTNPHDNDYWSATSALSGDGEVKTVIFGVTSIYSLSVEPSFQIWGIVDGGPTGVPEPQSLLLLGGGLLSLAFSRWRRLLWPRARQ